jgi:tetratricopeptide (TPR) repeat protein
MVRAFVDVFPQAVLLSGAESDLLLLGTTASRIEIDPERVAERLAAAPAVRADLDGISLGRPRDIVGSFVGAAPTLMDATRDVAPVIDDRPLQEYGVRSMLNFGHGVPEAVGDLTRIAEWCPRCFEGGAPAPVVEDLDTYFELMTLAYGASRADVARVRQQWSTEGRVVAGSSYLGAIVPESAETHNVLGISQARKGRIDAAVTEFREAIRLEPDNPAAHWHLGAALASQDHTDEATRHLARAVELDPQNGQARNDLGFMLAVQGRYAEAVEHLQQAVALAPQSAEARRNLELALERQRGPSKP